MKVPSLIWILKYIRVQRKISRKELAEAVGYKGEQSITEKESADIRPPPGVLSNWLEGLKIPREERRWFYRRHDQEVWLDILRRTSDERVLNPPPDRDDERLLRSIALLLANADKVHPDELDQFQNQLYSMILGSLASPPVCVQEASYQFAKGSDI